jgi:hypothetical protein
MLEGVRQAEIGTANERANGWYQGTAGNFDVGWFHDTFQTILNSTAGTEQYLPDYVGSRDWGDWHSDMATAWYAFWQPDMIAGFQPQRKPLLQTAALRLSPVRQGLLGGPPPDYSCLVDPSQRDCYPYFDFGFPPYPMPIPTLPPDPNMPNPWFDLTNTNTPKPKTKKLSHADWCFIAGKSLWFMSAVLRGMAAGGFIITAPEAWIAIGLILFVGSSITQVFCP